MATMAATRHHHLHDPFASNLGRRFLSPTSSANPLAYLFMDLLAVD
jgi:hypothetical protein